MPLVSRTRAIFRTAEFGFFGVVVVTFVHTPRLNGDGWNTGRFFIVLKLRVKATVFERFFGVFLPRRDNWLIVAIQRKKGGALVPKLYYRRRKNARTVFTPSL